MRGHPAPTPLRVRGKATTVGVIDKKVLGARYSVLPQLVVEVPRRRGGEASVRTRLRAVGARSGTLVGSRLGYS